MKHIDRLLTSALLALALPAAAQTYWTGQGTSLNWSDTGNWLGTIPDGNSLALFDDSFTTGYTNGVGKVNNVVDNGFTPPIRALAYTATNGHFYTTFIPDGKTLSVIGTFAENTLAVGNWTPFTVTTITNSASISGPGALDVNNPEGSIDIHQIGNATLNLSGLTNFTASVSNILVGVTLDPSIPRSPAGYFWLAQTNTITTAPNPAAPGVLLGRGPTNSFTSTFGQMTLGKQNVFNTDGLVVGGSRAQGTTTPNRLAFPTATANNLFTLRGSAGGSAPATVFSVGDQSATESGYNGAPFFFQAVNATADFSGGIVDILAGTLNVGRTGFDTLDTANDRGGSVGTLIFEQGTIDATNVNLGYYQHQLAGSYGQGTLTAKSNAVLNVRNNLTLGYKATTNGNTSTLTSGTLNVNDSAVVNVGGNIVSGLGVTTINLAGGAINMQPSWSAAPGDVGVKFLNGFGTISNANNITLDATVIPGTLTTPNSILLGGNLTLTTNAVLYFNVGTNTTVGPAGGSDYISAGGSTAQFNNPRMYLTLAGPLAPSAVYRLIDCTNAASVTGTVNAESPRYAPVMVTSTGVVMVVNADTNVGSVTWSGNIGLLWDTSLVNSNWVYAGSPDAFHQFDNVLFDDTCVSQVVWPSGTLSPSSITFDGNSKNLWVTNRSGVTPWGSMTGNGGFTKNGANTVTWGIATNTFTGPININNGVLKIFDPTFATPGGALVLGPSNSPINIASGATLDISGVGSISYGKTNFVSGTGFNGMGAITNSAASGSPTERWYFKLMGDTTFALNSAGMNIQNPAQVTTYGGWFDLNGFTLTKSGSAFLGLQQCSITNPGSINLAGGELRLNHAVLSGPGSLNLSNGTTLSCGTSGTTSLVAKASLNIPANATITAPNSFSAATPTFTIGSPVNLGGTLTVSNVMIVRFTNGISGAGSLTKIGSSNLVLTAANSFTGPTTINGGRIALTNSGSLASTNIIVNAGILDVNGVGGYTLASGQTVALNATTTNASVLGSLTVGSGATLLGIGTNNGHVTVTSGGLLSPGPLATVGTITIVSNLTLNAAGVTMNLGGTTTVGGTDNDLVQCSNLTLSGVSTIAISPVGALVTTPSTPYTLIRYTGTLSGDASNLSVVSANPRYTFTVIDPLTTPGSIQIQIASTGSTLDVWKGLAPGNPSAWDVGTSSNWVNGGSASAFFNGDTALFDDSGLTNGVDLVGTLSPAAIIVSNNASPYTFRGAGRLQAGTLTLDTTSTGGAVIANASSNTFNGAGITLNPGTTLTFSQPANSLLTSTLNGSGTLVQQSANSLTVIGNSGATFAGTNVIALGTLKPGSTDALGGTNATILATGGTLDLNGQGVAASTFAQGAGTGAGAVDNTGALLTTNKALASLVLSGPTTLGASSNNWEVGRWIPDPSYGSSQPPWVPVGSYFNAQGNALVKVGPKDVIINGTGETYLADVSVQAGRLIIANPTWSNNVPPTLGYPENTITISSNAALGLGGGFSYQMQPYPRGHDWGVDGGTKPIHVLSGGTLESISGSNYLGGPVTLETNSKVQSDESGGVLSLAGTVQGPGDLVILGNGAVRLSGNNTYTTNTVVSGATLMPATPAALPSGSLVVLSNSPSMMSLADSVTLPADLTLKMVSTGAGGGGSGPILGGDGTWSGPVQMTGSQGFVFNGSVNGLNITGPIDATGAGGTITVDFDAIRFATPLRFQGTFSGSYASGLSAGTLHRPILTFEGQNYWTNMNVARARINIRTNDALPPSAPITAGTLLQGVSDRTLILDLGGFNQTLSSVTATPGFINDFFIGNSSPDSDSTLTYAGTGANTWAAVIMDDLDLSGGKAIGLTVTSGSLALTAVSTYTGPTKVLGGTLLVNGPSGALGNTPVTVSGTGTFGGTGVVGGAVTNTAGGTVAPGVLVGTLTINNTLVLQAGGTCRCDVDNQLAANDKLVASEIFYGGTLLVNNTSAVAYTNGQTIKLFDATTYNGAFSSIEPLIPAPGLMWDASNLAVDGTLKIVAQPPTAPVVSGVARLADGNVGFTLTGVPGQPYTVRAATAVTDPLATWTVLQSGTLPATSYQFIDLTATNYARRFYQVSMP